MSGLRSHWSAVCEPDHHLRQEQLRRLGDVRWAPEAAGAEDCAWMAGSLAEIEAEMLPLIAMLMWIFYPEETAKMLGGESE